MWETEPPVVIGADALFAIVGLEGRLGTTWTGALAEAPQTEAFGLLSGFCVKSVDALALAERVASRARPAPLTTSIFTRPRLSSHARTEGLETYTCTRATVRADFTNVAIAGGTSPKGVNVQATDHANVKVTAKTTSTSGANFTG